MPILPSVLDPAGPQAAQIARLWWLIFWISAGVFVLVLAFLAKAVSRRRKPVEERFLRTAVALGTAVTAVILLIWLVASALVSRAIASPQMSNAVSINV